MSPTRRKKSTRRRAAARRKSATRRKSAKATMHPHEKSLIRAGLAKAARITDAQRKKIAKLTKAEVKALVTASRKLRLKRFF